MQADEAKPLLSRWSAIGWRHASAAAGGGVALIAASAQISFSLPISPVPITGQSWSVMFLALLAGRWVSLPVLTYIGLAELGAPILADGESGPALIGATGGYLVGMWVAAAVIGELAERGWAAHPGRAFAACWLGTVPLFGFGLLNLLRFVAPAEVLAVGLWPFLPGNLVKTAFATALAVYLQRKLGGRGATSESAR